MTEEKKRILVIGNCRQDNGPLTALTSGGNPAYDYVTAGSVSQAGEVFKTEKFEAVITDYLLDDGNAFDILRLAGQTPVIVVEESGNAELAVRAMKSGAYDHIIKDCENNYLKVLPLTIENALKRKRNEERIRLLESAVVNANDAIIVLEAEPRRDMGRRILYVNEAFTRMTGYSYDEAEGSTLRMLRGPRTDLGELKKIRNALNELRPIIVELANYRKDGSEFWVECNIVPFANEKGEFMHWVSVQRDITERKKSEAEREKLLKKIEVINSDMSELNQQLETIGAERTMSLMALTVADRIRNPASMIGARCKRILAKHELSEYLREKFRYIIEDADKLNLIVKEFETFLKSRQSKFKYEDLNKTVESIVSAVENEAGSKDVAIIINASKEPANINMQKDLLRVAVYHLIRNAIEATPGGGKVTIETSTNNEEVILSITDTGHGIAEQDIGNIFQPFFSTKEQGFGLGLPLVKQIISEHLGQLFTESKKGEGTTFKIVFPVRWKESKLY